MAAGRTHEDNLALACVSCSLRKGARETLTDPVSGGEVPVFNPRRERWTGHFRWDGNRLIGITPVGRAFVAALQLNRPLILAIRQEEAHRGQHPPPGHL